MKGKAAALLAACAVVVASSHAVRTATAPGTVRPAAAALEGLERAPGRLDAAELARLIGAYEDRLHARPDALEYGFLSRLYLERARLTGDVNSYTQAAAAATAALRIGPGDTETRVRLASIRSSLHDFAGALELAHEILSEDPNESAAVSLAGDAFLELGDYAAATDSYGRLAALAPGAAAVEARLARLAFLRGDTPGAVRLAEAAQRAAAAEGAFGPGLAWYGAFRSQIELDAGRYDVAAKHAEAAVAAAPGYHVGLAALARARAAQGRTADAIRLLESAVAAVPQPDLAALLGDLLLIGADGRGAEDQYRTVEAIGRLVRANRQVYNRPVALFLADHGRHPAEAVRLAEAELRLRRDIYGWDVYAWALHAAARDAEARAASDRALALGTRDARLWYHAGMISAALGDTESARLELTKALEISPAFDPIQATRAREALAALNAEGSR